MTARWPVTDADLLVAYLAERDAKCPECRYSLRGLRKPVCPECGRALELWELYRRRSRFKVSDLVLTTPMLTLVIVVNVLLALAVILAAADGRGGWPVPAWPSPVILGATLFSVCYWTVFWRAGVVPTDEVPGWLIGAGAGLILVQIVGLVMIVA